MSEDKSACPSCHRVWEKYSEQYESILLLGYCIACHREQEPMMTRPQLVEISHNAQVKRSAFIAEQFNAALIQESEDGNED